MTATETGMASADAADMLRRALRSAEHRVASFDRLTLRALELLEPAEVTSIQAHTGVATSQALEGLRMAVERPAVVIAVTGTTSSGKSTLINFLCGARLLPAAVGEKSAGAVFVLHHPHRRVLTVEPTHGAAWEVGTFEMGSADEVRARLGDVMDRARNLREKGDAPEQPRFRLEWPTRVGADPTRFGLPAGASIQFLDLPGLRYVGDDVSAKTIRDTTREALCLVTYNAASTNPRTREELLGQVVTQVKNLGGSPARMLFVANRIDEFRRDEDWKASERAFLEALTVDTRARVKHELPEHARAAEGLRILPLSSEAAMAAELLRSEDRAAQDWALECIDRDYARLIPEEVLERLPRRVSAAGSAERAAVREAVLLESHGVAFEQALLAHIRANLPALLLPQHESAIDAALREGVGHLDTLINAAVKGSSKRFEEEKARLETLSVQLDRLREDLGKKLTPLKDILETGELISDEGKSRRVLTRIAKEHGLEDGALIPFLAWNDELGKQLDALLSTIAGHLEKGGPLTFASAGVTERQASRVRRAIEALVDAGYDQAVAARGDKREAAGKSEKAQLHRMNEALNGLADALTPAVTSMIRTLVQREGDRIHQAMQALLAAQLRELEVGTERLSNDLALRLPPPELAKVGQELVWEPELSLGFKVRQVDRIVQVGVREETYLAEKSFWNLYGFLNRRKTREVPVREQRSFDRADIPGAQDLLFSFLEQIQADSPADAVTRWLRESFESFDRQMAEFHRDRVERYRARLLVEQKRARERKDAELAALTKLREDLARVVAGPGA